MQLIPAYLGPNATGIFTTNIKGYSQGEYAGLGCAGLNLADHVGDDSTAVDMNRQLIQQRFGIKLAFMQQTHSDIVQVVQGDDYQLCECDSIVSNSKELKSQYPPAVLIADCTPVLLADESGLLRAAVHVGRKGMQNQILPKTLEYFFQSAVRPEQIYAAVGPAICGNCYPVAEEVYVDCLKDEPGSAWKTPQGLQAVNVRKAVLEQLRRNGVDNITDINICTYENENFYSYRRSEITGRQCGFVLDNIL